jgi:hypothetical protein
MAKQGFQRDAKAIADILHNDPALKAAQKAVADELAAKSGGEVVEYETDRAVYGVKVPAYLQARDGVLTKAAGSTGRTLE